MRTRLLLLALVLLGGTWLRVIDLGHSLWLDELHTAWTVSEELGDVAPRARLIVSSPLYYWLLWSVVQGVGVSEWSLRLPSLLAGLGTIVAVYLLALRWFGRPGPAWVAAAIVAVEPAFLFHAQNARPYALVQILVVVQVWLLYERALHGTRGWRLAFVGVSVGLVYVHYTASLVVGAGLVWCAIRWALARRRGEPSPIQRPIRLLWDSLILGALVLPGLADLWSIAGRRGEWALFIPRPSWLEAVIVFPVVEYVVLPLAASGIAAIGWRATFRRGPLLAAAASRGAALLVACWYLVPIGLTWLATVTDVLRSFYPRYLAGSLVALPLALAGASSRWSANGARAAGLSAALLALVFGSGVVPSLRSGEAPSRHDVEDWRGVAAWIEDREPRPIFLRTWLMEADRILEDGGDELALQYLQIPFNNLYAFRDGRPILPLSNDLKSGLRDRWLGLDTGRAWFVLRSLDTSDFTTRTVAGELRRAFRTAGLPAAITETHVFRGVLVFGVELPDAPRPRTP